MILTTINNKLKRGLYSQIQYNYSIIFVTYMTCWKTINLLKNVHNFILLQITYISVKHESLCIFNLTYHNFDRFQWYSTLFIEWSCRKQGYRERSRDSKPSPVTFINETFINVTSYALNTILLWR